MTRLFVTLVFLVTAPISWADDADIYNSLTNRAQIAFRSRTTVTYEKTVGRLSCYQLVSLSDGVLNTSCRLGASLRQPNDYDIIRSLRGAKITRTSSFDYQRDLIQVGRLYCETLIRFYNTLPQVLKNECLLRETKK